MDGKVWNTNALLRDTNVSIWFKMECTEWPRAQYSSHNQIYEPMATHINKHIYIALTHTHCLGQCRCLKDQIVSHSSDVNKYITRSYALPKMYMF